MYNVREVLDLLDNSDVEDFIISDEEHQATPSKYYYNMLDIYMVLHQADRSG